MQKPRKYTLKRSNHTETPSCPGNILEADKPLSQSMIWKLQADFYANQGPKAWIKGIVPQYITTNPYIANVYAKTVFGYLRDFSSTPEFDKDTTIYIMELAAGVGRFTYTFLKRFLHMLHNSSLKDLKFKYILTDLAERNVTYWQNHSYLKPYFESGVLDCAVFDMENGKELSLRYSKTILQPEALKNPLILFANYTFDSIPQDTFYVKSNNLHEGLITITEKDNQKESESRKDNSILEGLDYYYTDNRIEGNDYYEDVNFNDILLSYKDCMEDTAFSMPVTALRCIRRLQDIFGDDILLLSTDKGYRTIASMDKNYHPFLSKHGSISLTVNFHAIELYFKNLGGSALHSIYEHESVTTSLFLLSKHAHSFRETRMTYQEITEGIGPDDFYILKKGIVPLKNSLTTREMLTFLRYTLWDARTFLEFYNTLLNRIEKEEDFPKETLIDAIYKVWEYYFPIGEDENLFYCLATLLGYFGYDKDAIRLFQSSLEFYGEDAAIYYELTLCYYNMQEFEKALEHINKALLLKTDFEEALSLKNLLTEVLQS
ncbi:tetratricopeptide repeat protein [Anaerocolumna chitinilytica]|uniref:Tetratricopeptide repeat protein n=1 Tax=Anaerocolumna chitinilytica TaxID=1727145 RepID=A0A7I8DF89_9FIRM|nr:tetratricopeptide repeat protein [Anaerocolumna chitinilytica]BCJ97119.1 hypothetical protein bsdcttw_01600 [Anaerocolumna chitinilytica]